MVRKRLHSLQRRLALNAELSKQYQNVTNEYLDLHNFSTIYKSQANESGFYLPDHAVIKPGSPTSAVEGASLLESS